MRFLIRAVNCALLILSLSSTSVFADPDATSVNINTADAATLSKVLKGVGLGKAEAIVTYRKAHGQFKAAEELTEVKGIGSKLVELNQKKIRL